MPERAGLTKASDMEMVPYAIHTAKLSCAERGMQVKKLNIVLARAAPMEGQGEAGGGLWRGLSDAAAQQQAHSSKKSSSYRCEAAADRPKVSPRRAQQQKLWSRPLWLLLSGTCGCSNKEADKTGEKAARLWGTPTTRGRITQQLSTNTTSQEEKSGACRWAGTGGKGATT